MTAHLFFSMAAFALVTSISPGPVNIVALGSGARYGFCASQRHVAGAAFGFTLLLLLVGLGLNEVLNEHSSVTAVLQWAGAAYLLFMAWGLVRDRGDVKAEEGGNAPSFFNGALMQWLNPKAWLAAVAGIAFYAANGEAFLVWIFSVLYFTVCYVSVACWSYAGAFLRRFLGQEKRIRAFNRLMAGLLVASAACLLVSS